MFSDSSDFSFTFGKRKAFLNIFRRFLIHFLKFCVMQPQVYMIFFKSNSNLLVFTWNFPYNADRQSGLL